VRRRGEGLGECDPDAIAAAPGTHLAKSGIDDLLTELLRKGALDITARWHVGDADRERAHLVVPGKLQRRAQIRALGKAVGRLIQARVLAQRRNAGMTSVAADVAQRVDGVDHIGASRGRQQREQQGERGMACRPQVGHC